MSPPRSGFTCPPIESPRAVRATPGFALAVVTLAVPETPLVVLWVTVAPELTDAAAVADATVAGVALVAALVVENPPPLVCDPREQPERAAAKAAIVIPTWARTGPLLRRPPKQGKHHDAGAFLSSVMHFTSQEGGGRRILGETNDRRRGVIDWGASERPTWHVSTASRPASSSARAGGSRTTTSSSSRDT
jgi:hypothetical protein